METVLSSNPQKTKEKLLTFLLVFLILLVPLSLLTRSSGPDVDIQGLYTQTLSGNAQRVFFELHNVKDFNVQCKLVITYYKNNAPFEKDVQQFGLLNAGETKQGSLLLEFPSGQSSMKIEPDCLGLSP